MKQFLFVIAMAAFLFVVDGAAQTAKNGKNVAVEFQKYDSYFVKNNAGLTGEKSYLALANQTSFDKVFGAAATMGQNNFLPTDAFKTKIIVAVIKNGGGLRRYADVKVTAEKGKLIVWYDTKDDAPGSATYSSLLILGIDKGKYKEVVFMENGKKAGTVKLKKIVFENRRVDKVAALEKKRSHKFHTA